MFKKKECKKIANGSYARKLATTNPNKMKSGNAISSDEIVKKLHQRNDQKNRSEDCLMKNIEKFLEMQMNIAK